TVARVAPGPEPRGRRRLRPLSFPSHRRDDEPRALTALSGSDDGSLISDAHYSAALDFVYKEARLADEARYAEWLALWTDDDGVYWVPASTGPAANPDTHISHVYDNRGRIDTRVKLLQTGPRYSQEPASLMRRPLSNLGVER